MAADHEQPDDGDEAQLAWLMTTAHDAPELRGKFVRELSQRLDVEFAAASAEFVQRNGEAAHAMNGAAHKAEEVEKLEVAKPQAAPRRRRRWVVGAAVAASLMMAVAVWADPPTWQAVVRAIVRGIGGLTGGRIDDSAQLGNPVEQVAPVAPEAAKPQATAEPAPPVDAIARSVVKPPVVPEEVVTPIDKEKPKTPSDEPLWEPKAQDKLSQTIDEQLAALWLAQRIHPVGPSSDAEFMRRVYLDLTGRIPMVSEAREFLEDKSPDRREKLVDRLLAHRDHATHLATVWRQILIPDDIDLSRYGGAAKFEEWLAGQFASNDSYDNIVRKLLLATGRVQEPGPLLFYAALRLNPEELAARSSRAFLGMRMECAQCHDHKLDPEFMSQHDFWSFAAFFARISRPRGKMEMTSPVLAVRDNQQGDVMIPDSEEVVPPRLPKTAADLEDAADGPSRREVLANWLTSQNNGQFARATVNRVWSQLFGRGLVEPVDDMRPANAPLAPELLDVLSRDFAASKFDLRRLLRALVLTNAYQLSSRSEDDPSRALYFAQMNVKSFTAEQLYDCIAVATQRAAVAGGPTSEAGLLRYADTDRQTFLQQFRAPPGQATDYHAGIPQALTLMHGGLITSGTDLTTSGLLHSLTFPIFTDEERLDALFLSTLSRTPEPAERELMLKAITAAESDEEKQRALGDVLWALLNSAEFTFNH